MTYYLLYDPEDSNFPYAFLRNDGYFSKWKSSMEELLLVPIYHYMSTDTDVERYIDNPPYTIMATFDHKPTVETDSELLL